MRVKGELMSIGDIKEGVSRLSIKEQAALAYWIIHNLEVVTEDEDVVDVAWRKEVRSRVQAIKSGKVQMIPGEKMWKDILGNYVKTI
jgi:putative addiction module component (TIGR02574 family)